MSDNVPWPSQGGTRKAKWGCEPVAQRPGVGQNIRSRLDAVCGTGCAPQEERLREEEEAAKEEMEQEQLAGGEKGSVGAQHLQRKDRGSGRRWI